MRLFLLLVLLFCLMPVIELALLIYVSYQFLGWGTLGIVIATGIVGAALAKHQGRQAWSAVRQALRQGQLPATQMVDALLILIAGVVLLTPGFITDAIGFFLLIPYGRSVIRGALANWFKRQIASGSVSVWHPGTPSTTSPPEDPDVIQIDPSRVHVSDDD